MTHGADLSGFTVGVTADRRAEEQAVMLRRLGVDVVFGPALRTLTLDDDDELRASTEALIERPPDYMVANTGFGVRHWLSFAARWGIESELKDALAHSRILARGPKAAGALRIAGMDVWWRSPAEQLASVADRLVEEGVSGCRIAFQLHGDDRQTFTAAMVAAGAEVVEIPVYRWLLPSDDQPAVRLIELCCAGRIDAITFTAGPAVRQLVELADALGRSAEFVAALNRNVIVACVGPVCAAVAEEEGLTNPLVPVHWRLGSLVRLVADALETRPKRQLA